jgi:hypothetical protein
LEAAARGRQCETISASGSRRSANGSRRSANGSQRSASGSQRSAEGKAIEAVQPADRWG